MSAGALGGALFPKIYGHFIQQIAAYNKEGDLIAREKLIVPNGRASLSCFIDPASLYRLARPGEVDLDAQFEVDVAEENLDGGTPVTKVRYTFKGDVGELGEFGMAMARAEQDFDPRVGWATQFFREKILPEILAQSDAAEGFSGEVYADSASFGEDGQYEAMNVEFRVGINHRPFWDFNRHISLGGAVQIVEDQSPGIDLPKPEAARGGHLPGQLSEDEKRIVINSLNTISEGNGGIPAGLDIAEFLLTGGGGMLAVKGTWALAKGSTAFFKEVGVAVAGTGGGGRGRLWARLRSVFSGRRGDEVPEPQPTRAVGATDGVPEPQPIRAVGATDEAAGLIQTIAFDSTRHGRTYSYGLDYANAMEEGGFVSAPMKSIGGFFDGRRDYYTPEGSYLFGKRTRIGMFEENGMRVVEGELVGQKRDWRVLLIRERNTGETVEVPSKRADGTSHSYNYLPPPSVSIDEFMTRFASFKPLDAPGLSIYDLAYGIQSSKRQAFLVNFGTHIEVLIGRARVNPSGGRYYISIETDLGNTTVQAYQVLRYTSEEVI